MLKIQLYFNIVMVIFRFTQTLIEYNSSQIKIKKQQSHTYYILSYGNQPRKKLNNVINVKMYIYTYVNSLYRKGNTLRCLL